MQALLGFELDFWNYLTFLTLALVVVLVVVAHVWLAGLQRRIAIARKHPDARRAVDLAGVVTRPRWLTFDIGFDTLTGVNDADYKPPFPLTTQLSKLTIKVDRPQLSPAEINKLETAIATTGVSPAPR